jgi:predicted short-subunit dehydrogenase-like oxidoreductase (DUF2520 family)
MIEIVILGSGNVATHLFKAFSASEGIKVKQVYNHSEKSLDVFTGKTAVTTEISELADADVYLLALKDDVIPQVAGQLQNKKALIAHTSGAVSLDDINSCERRGVFYPLQTFSKHREVTYSNIPFCLESKHPEDLALLKQMAAQVSGKLYEIDSQQRKKLHLSAVFVCNFVNHLYAIGEKLCTENNMEFELLQPLIMETAEKILKTAPATAQTGPAIRKDQSTIEAHLQLLESSKNKEIYQLLTSSIQSFHGKKL